MPRIRSIKPSFFRHEGLQELEIKHRGKYPMFVFAGLWGHCDKLGRFRWKPRTLKLDILPFLPFDMEATLLLLKQSGYLKQYEVEGQLYGFIPTFTEHQRINGKEAQEPAEFPDPIDFQDEISVKQWGSTSEAVETTGREGKGIGREQEQEGNCGEAIEKQNLMIPSDKPTVEAIMALWNSMPGVHQAKAVTGPIRKLLTTRIREHPDVNWFQQLFQSVSRSDFLTGKKTDFVVTLDWVLGPKNMAKVLNGNYDNRQGMKDPNGFLAGMKAFIERG